MYTITILLKKITLSLLVTLTLAASSKRISGDSIPSWDVTVIPASVRLDPVTNKIIDDRFTGSQSLSGRDDVLRKNWIFDGKKASLFGARGEYISFQLVITNRTEITLKGIQVDMSGFKNSDAEIKINPELFLEWAVQVKTPSTGYPKSSLGKGWYPDALIPFSYIQDDPSQVHGRLVYPLWLPDFNNRIDNQRSMVIWVDQFIPYSIADAKPGIYSSTVSVKIGGEIKTIPVHLTLWDFAISNENKFKASLQHEGFLSRKQVKEELAIYQLCKRNRVALMDPTYEPELQVDEEGKVDINWTAFDERLSKYFTGDAFTSKYGYDHGPGYGEPIESFILPFDVYGKHGTKGWPDIGGPEVEKKPENKATYIEAIKQVRKHLHSFISNKTDITVYLNGLDESYFPEAYDRMVYYGNLFNIYFPEAHFRIDGGYDEQAMEVLHDSIDYWAAHTINYDIQKVRKYQDMGIKEWLYGPMLYESKVNSWVGSSTFIDLPLVNDRAISWSCWKYNTYSWISWGIGAGWERGWYDPESWKDAYKAGAEADSVFSSKKLNGNALLIYSPGIIPNVNGPCPSIRLKTMRNGIQEYEYMRLLAKLDQSKARVDSIVNKIIKQPFGDKSIGNLDVWSYDAQKWDENRINLGMLINEKSRN